MNAIKDMVDLMGEVDARQRECPSESLEASVRHVVAATHTLPHLIPRTAEKLLKALGKRQVEIDQRATKHYPLHYVDAREALNDLIHGEPS